MRDRTSTVVRIARGLSLLAFTLVALLWMAGVGAALSGKPGDRGTFTIGFGLRDGWLVNARIDARGILIIRYFPQNLTERSGIYCDISRVRSMRLPFWRTMIPRRTPERASTMHVANVLPLLLILCVPVVLLVVKPFLRTRRRLRQCRCVACGYDMHERTSNTCPECGYLNTALPEPSTPVGDECLTT